MPGRWDVPPCIAIVADGANLPAFRRAKVLSVPGSKAATGIKRAVATGGHTARAARRSSESGWGRAPAAVGLVLPA